MDTTAASLLGQQLSDFLVKQFAPPAGTKNALGFLGTGVAVDPTSFLSQGEFNPARINSWLNIVVDPLGGVVKDGNWVESTPWTASELMQTVASQAVCAAPAGSDDLQGFARAKSLAQENLGGATTVNTAPLDWYDPAQVAKWPKCSFTTSTTTTSSSGTGTGATPLPLEPPPGTSPPSTQPPPPPLWAWRTLGKVDVTEVDRSELPISKGPAVGMGIGPMRAQHIIASASMMAPASPVMRAQVMRVSQVSDVEGISIDRAPAAFVSETATTRVSAAHAVIVSQAISTAADQASTSSVASTSLTLNLSYLVVSLSRAPWWSDLMLLLDNWYVPSLGRAALISDGDPQKATGVPIALVLTSDVTIQSTWSAADRAAASSNTHFGPWALSSAQFASATTAGEAILTIPGITAIACIYRELPALPPKADPSLAPANDPPANT